MKIDYEGKKEKGEGRTGWCILRNTPWKEVRVGRGWRVECLRFSDLDL